MEAQETNVASTPPTGRLALASAVCLCAGVGLFGVCLLANRLFDEYSHKIEDIFGLIGMVGFGAAYVVAPLLGLVAVVMTLNNRRSTLALAAKESRSTQLMARRFCIAGVLLATVPFLLLVVAFIEGYPLHVMLPQWLAFWHLAIALLALAMGWVSLRLTWRVPDLRVSRTAAFGAVVFGIVSVTLAFGQTCLGAYLSQLLGDLARHRTFAGDSSLLERTVVVPTLDSPCPPGKNVIWCSSFQLAWNEIRDNVIGAPLEVVGAETLAARLNQSESSRADLGPESVYAAAGWVKDGIIPTIQEEMADRFPSQPLPDFTPVSNEPNAIAAYTYLTAQVPFTHPFRQVPGGFTFTDSQGVETRVDGFGLDEYRPQDEVVAEQVEILFLDTTYDANAAWPDVKEFGLDLCKQSTPYQVVVALVEPRESLAETLHYIRGQIEDFKQRAYYEEERVFQMGDILTAPELFWRIDHRFTELIGKVIANTGTPIVEAMQTIEFKLDRSGARIASSATVLTSGMPRCFSLSRPFLIYMKKRDAERPFFVMWVDNAELLVRK